MKRFLNGFGYAFQGIQTAMRQEQNLRFHLVTMGFVLLFSSCFYTLSAVEYALLFICFGAVIAAELLNSAIERAVQNPDAAHWALAGQAKDMAAGAVLVLAIMAVAVGACVLGKPAQLREMMLFFWQRPWAFLGLLALLLACGVWVFGNKEKGKKS